jgi:hypothetical protein
MYNADRSASGRIRMLKAKTLAAYHARNPAVNDYGGEKPSSALTHLLRSVGSNELCGKCCEPVCDASGAIFFPFPLSEISNLETQLSEIIGQPITFPGPPIGYPEERDVLFGYFPEICHATSYTMNLYNPTPIQLTQYFLGTYNTEFLFPRTGFILAYPLADLDYGNPVDITLVASNECSSSSTNATFGCFLAGSQIAMADGSFKAIESVAVGDSVRGAFGEINTVLGLHRPLLGAGTIVNINNEHKSTTHHPHVAADKKMYCVAPHIINSFTYGKTHKLIVDNTGKTEYRNMYGLHPDRIQTLEVGVELQTLAGAKRVDSLDFLKMSPFTQVYHLAVDGSHTFMVDGYAVTGWPREDDFDYDAWVPRDI